MSYRTKPGYTADTQANITAQVPDVEDGAICFAIAEQTAWQLSLTSVATVGADVLATKSGTGRWLRVSLASSAASSADWFYGLGLTGVLSVGAGVTAAALTAATESTTLTIGAAGVQPLGGMPICSSGLASLAAGAILSNDGGNGADNAVTAGVTGVLGQLGGAQPGTGGQGGGSGGGFAGVGLSVAISLGGNGGAGGANGSADAGSAGGVVTRPSGSTNGFSFVQDLLFITRTVGGTQAIIVRPNGGAGGGGGRGSGLSVTVGAGGGGGGGLVLGRFASLSMATGSKIRANGGRGGNNANLNAGAGGGGGGGCVIVVTNSLSVADAMSSHFEALGGAAGIASNGGASGVAGSSGIVRVYVGGVLVYSIG